MRDLPVFHSGCGWVYTDKVWGKEDCFHTWTVWCCMLVHLSIRRIQVFGRGCRQWCRCPVTDREDPPDRPYSWNYMYNPEDSCLPWFSHNSPLTYCMSRLNIKDRLRTDFLPLKKNSQWDIVRLDYSNKRHLPHRRQLT